MRLFLQRAAFDFPAQSLKHAVPLLLPGLAQQSGKVFLRGSEGPTVSSGSLLLLS